ncbi:MAG: DUF6293 family protein [archaeon]|nr:DUF6293 family protein [archaeon]
MAIKKCVVISCVSFETAMNVEPAVSYGADEVHLFHYVRDPTTDSGKIYDEFYSEVCSQLKDKLPKVRIIEHNKDPIYDFQLMFRDILGIINDVRNRNPDHDPDDDCYVGPDAEILINASAGTSEFSAAAIIASMMSKGVNSFTVGTREYTVKNEDIRNLYYKAGRPVGLTEHTHSPRIIPNFDIEMPDENLIRALRSYYKRSQDGKMLSASCIIQQLKDEGIWMYQAAAGERKTNMKQKETMYYQRHYLEVWIANGWIEKPQGYSKYKLTDNGLVAINTFYTN